MLRLGGHLVAAGNFAYGDAVAGLVEFRDELVEEVLDALRGLLQGCGDLRERERFIGYVDDGFQNRFDLRVFLGDWRGSVVEGDIARGHQLIDREGGLRRDILGGGGIFRGPAGYGFCDGRRRFGFRAFALRVWFQFIHA